MKNWDGLTILLNRWRALWAPLLVVLWMNPSTNIDGSPLTDLQKITIEVRRDSYPNTTYYFDRPAWQVDSLGVKTYISFPGQEDSLHLTLPSPRVPQDWWTLRAFAVDDSMNYSAPSNSITVNLGVGSPVTGVELPDGVVAVDEWFDVHGRSIERPIASGVYFRRRGALVEKVVVVK